MSPIRMGTTRHRSGKWNRLAFSTSAAWAVKESFPPPSSAIVVDDATGTPAGPAFNPELLARLHQQKLATEAPTRSNGFGAASQFNNGYSGTASKPGTLSSNYLQQQWLADVTTKAVLPEFEAEGKPFVIVFWARDPDATQHNRATAWAHSIRASMVRVRERPSKTLIITCAK